jgi:hypothetical protein
MVLVHCFRCDDVIEASTEVDGPLQCPQCDDTVLGPPADSDDRSVRWSSSGLLLAGQTPDDPDVWRPRRRSMGTSMLAAGMLGLQQAMFGPIDDEPAIEVVDDEPDGERDVDLHLDDERPTDSWIRFNR